MERKVTVTEQPETTIRFRYKCETGRGGGLLVGASSIPENKVFPAIQIGGYQGRAVAYVSCVTKDEPFRPHPHKLVGREECTHGVCKMHVPQDTMMVKFNGLGIQCTKRDAIKNALNIREKTKIDPFKTGFAHRNEPRSIDLTTVRLCFQVFVENKKGECTVPLAPVVSTPIYDKKVYGPLVIVKLSKCVAPVDGGDQEIILVCNNVAKGDIQIQFFEERNHKIVWQGLGSFSDVYKKVVISFKPPSYENLDITEPVKVFIQLYRPSTKEASEPLPFEFLPLYSESEMLKNMRTKFKHNLMNHPLLQPHRQEQNRVQQFDSILLESGSAGPSRDITPSPYSPYNKQVCENMSNFTLSSQHDSVLLNPMHPKLSGVLHNLKLDTKRSLPMNNLNLPSFQQQHLVSSLGPTPSTSQLQHNDIKVLNTGLDRTSSSANTINLPSVQHQHSVNYSKGPTPSSSQLQRSYFSLCDVELDRTSSPANTPNIPSVQRQHSENYTMNSTPSPSQLQRSYIPLHDIELDRTLSPTNTRNLPSVQQQHSTKYSMDSTPSPSQLEESYFPLHVIELDRTSSPANTSNFPSVQFQQQHSVDYFMDAISSPTQLQRSYFPHPDIELDATPSPENTPNLPTFPSVFGTSETTHPILDNDVTNDLGAYDFSGMNGLSYILNDMDNNQPKLQEITIDSGELNAMNTFS